MTTFLESEIAYKEVYIVLETYNNSLSREIFPEQGNLWTKADPDVILVFGLRLCHSLYSVVKLITLI